MMIVLSRASSTAVRPHASPTPMHARTASAAVPPVHRAHARALAFIPCLYRVIGPLFAVPRSIRWRGLAGHGAKAVCDSTSGSGLRAHHQDGARGRAHDALGHAPEEEALQG